MAETILLVEDEEKLARMVELELRYEGYEVEKAFDGRTGLERALSGSFDLVLLDIMLPALSGMEVLRRLRQEGNSIPVLMLTAKGEVEDKVLGLDSGADDYMTKPVNYEELTWRINALLRRAHIASERRIVIGPVVLDSNTYTVSRGEQVLELPKKEFELLYKLLSYPGQIFTRNQLLDDIWGFDSESGEDTVKTHISRLRNKLRAIEEFRIITIKGLGYKAEVLELSLIHI